VEPITESPSAFFLYRESRLRREALRLAPGAGERYSLYGLDEIAASGIAVAHNLERGRRAGVGARIGGRMLHRVARMLGGYPGDFGSVLACRRELNRADVVFSTVDTVGIPLVLLARGGLVRTPVVYAAIGLPERLVQLKNGAMRRLYRSAYGRLHTIVAYGSGEVDALRGWLGDDGSRVVFVPFGVDCDYFRPDYSRPAAVDIVSIGADPRRDYGLLLEVARRRPGWSMLAVASGDHAPDLAAAPGNVRVELDVPLEVVREQLLTARVVALPVRANTYSGATTVLLQAMACGKPVVVSRTAAIAEGYRLENGRNCLLVPPGDVEALERGVSMLLEDPDRAATVGAHARATVERHLGWERYAAAVRELLLAACERTTVPA
jgi:glycosyltransferase involved in cell wall biosynthesis